MHEQDLAHAVAIVLIGVSAEQFHTAVGMLQDDGGMMYAVEHRGLDGSVVYHVFEDYLFSDLQFMVEAPVAHKVTTQATIAAESVEMHRGGRGRL